MVGLLIGLLVQSHQMKVVVALITLVFLSSVAHSQSGRRPKEIKAPVPVPEATADNASEPEAATNRGATVTAERNQDYRCTDDGTLERIIENDQGSTSNASAPLERIFTAKETDTRVEITSKPQPSYTREARRNGIQGFVALKVLLSGNGKVSRVRLLKGLRAGLTENAIRAACRMRFKPAVKDGVTVSQWVIAEYAFRLADSSIFRP